MDQPDAPHTELDSVSHLTVEFTRLGVVLKPDCRPADREGILNPASARLRDGTLWLYPRMVATGNVSRIGRFSVNESGSTLTGQQHGFALEPQAPYELRNESDGYGCEDPRVTYIRAIDRYVMSYVAFGPRGPEVALAVSADGLTWDRLGLVRFKKSTEPFADKDAAFFPEPVMSPSGIPSLALYHRPTLWALWRKHGKEAVKVLKQRRVREDIAIAYISLKEVRDDVSMLCEVNETHPLRLPDAQWGRVKVGGGTPPVRIREGWLAIIHGVDELPRADGHARLRYCAGIIIHDAKRVDHVLYRSPTPLFGPELPSEIGSGVVQVVFPTAIDPRPDVGKRVFDIYYGMGDREVGRGRLTLKG